MAFLNPCSVDKLPTEVLAIIFAIVAQLDPPHHANNILASALRRKGHLGWIKLTHVCRRWREIGIECAKLWADIITVFPSSTSSETIIGRIKGAPVVLDLRAINDQQVHDCFLERFLHRARVIQAEYDIGSGKERLWVYQVLSGRNLPTLECLKLEYNRSIDLGFEDTPYEPISSLASLHGPALTIASLTTFFPLMAPRLRALTVNKDWKCTVPEAVEYLQMFPELEELSLRLKIVNAPTSNMTVIPVVEFSCLRHFINECNDFSIARIVPHMRFPKMTTLEFYLSPKARRDIQDDLDLHAICRTISPQMREASRTQLVIECDSMTNFSVIPYSSLKDLEDEIPMARTGVMIGGGFEIYRESALAAVVTQVADSITTLMIRSFRADEVPTKFADLRSSFTKLATVQELVVHHRGQRIFSAFRWGNALFPQLKRIILDFTTSEEADNDSHDSHWFMDLLDMLDMREIAGYHPVKEIVLRGSCQLGPCPGASDCVGLNGDQYTCLDRTLRPAGRLVDLRSRPDLMDNETHIWM